MIYNKDKIHSSWEAFFNEDIVNELNKIEELIGDDYNPDADKVLRFANVDLNKVKVIILGQDPYPQKGVPSGRSFEVQGLNSWLDKFKQSSLRNILRNIYKSYTGELLSITEIRGKIKDGEFKILPPNEIYDYWESQGVLMLNTYLTCKAGEPGSHRKYWDRFSKQLLKYIVDNNSNIVWFLWGSEAKSNINILKNQQMYTSNHPMMSNPKNSDDFINCKCFEDTIKTLGIDWIGENK